MTPISLMHVISNTARDRDSVKRIGPILWPHRWGVAFTAPRPAGKVRDSVTMGHL